MKTPGKETSLKFGLGLVCFFLRGVVLFGFFFRLLQYIRRAADKAIILLQSNYTGTYMVPVLECG